MPASSPNAASTLRAQLVDVELGGVDHEVGAPRRSPSSSRSRREPVEQPAVALQRVRSAVRSRSGGPARRRRPRGTARARRRPAPRSRRARAAARRTARRRVRRRRRRPLRTVPPRRRRADHVAGSSGAAGCRRRTSRGPPGTCAAVAAAGAGHAGDDQDDLDLARADGHALAPSSRSTLDALLTVVDDLAGRGVDGDAGRLEAQRLDDGLRGPGPCRGPRRSPRRVAARSRFSDPKCAQQRLRGRRPSPGTSSSSAVASTWTALGAVVGDREPVRLVAHPLQQVEPLAGARQDHRVGVAGQPHLLEPLRQPARPRRRRCRARRARAAAAATCGGPPSTTTSCGG